MAPVSNPIWPLNLFMARKIMPGAPAGKSAAPG